MNENINVDAHQILCLELFFPKRTQSKCSNPNHTLIQPQILVNVAAPIVCFVVKNRQSSLIPLFPQIN